MAVIRDLENKLNMQKSISANRKNEKQSLSLAEFFLLEVFSNVYFGEERFSF